MSIFSNWFKSKKNKNHTATMTFDDSSWQTTANPTIFFIDDNANTVENQKDFISRFVQQVYQETENVQTIDNKVNLVVKRFTALRQFNQQMSIDSRTFLAQEKRQLIHRLEEENT
ncbi:hypothetical protein AAYR18_05515 [Leuconostoc fallax]|uniref:hypothetical protein n=1 Tax=Leuconostoc fallax TaxID=1251 RepID=UPI002090CEA1|nr:hypothetical protein [Leuconostoc fallax]MCO6184144.1 hypothetical protein [Leuconostoc fallax]